MKFDTIRSTLDVHNRKVGDDIWSMIYGDFGSSIDLIDMFLRIPESDYTMIRLQLDTYFEDLEREFEDKDEFNTR